MIKQIFRKISVFFFCYALAFTPLLNAGQLSLPSGDLVAPEIIQPKYIDSVAKGDNHSISVVVTDNTGVKQVVLYYRVIGTSNYQRKLMRKVKNTDNYQVTLRAKKITPPGIEYYVQAMDHAGNTILHGYSFSPLSVKTTSATAVVVENNPKTSSSEDDDSIFTNKWFWIGIGVLVAGAAASGGGGSGGGGGGEPTATLTVNAAEPIN